MLMWSLCPPESFLLFFLSLLLIRGAVQQSLDQCCRKNSNITVINAGDLRTSDGRRATLFCALDSADVPNIDLGFLEQGQPNSGKFTLSIFLRAPLKMSLVEELWSANRDDPVGINSTLLFGVGQGFSLLDESGRLVWSAGTSASAGFMLDCTVGNLVLLDSGNATLWQSFDHPTDTLMQNQTLTQGMKLVSRSSTYSLAVEHGGLALYDRFEQPYWIWTLGGSNNTVGVRAPICQNTTQLSSIQIVNIGFINLMTCAGSGTMMFNSYPISDNKLRFMKLDDAGRLQVYDWNLGSPVMDYDFLGGSECAIPDYCGSFGVCQNRGQCSCMDRFSQLDPSDTTQGCRLPPGEGNLTCSSGGRTSTSREMVETRGLKSLASEYTTVNVTVPSAEACSSSCLNNCSCRAAVYNLRSSGCFVYEDEFIQSFVAAEESESILFVKLPKSANKSSSKTGVIVGVAISVPLVILVLGGVTFMVCRRRKLKLEEEDLEDEEEAFLGSLPGLPPRFTLKSLEEATDGFSKKLGHGGFGEVYLGRVNGMQVAVKKLASAHQGTKEFRAEVATIGNIHHVNLARLRGFCATRTNRLLVYDYMSNGSLDQWLFGGSERTKLDWRTRYNVALGTARGLAYLHESCKEKILHLDVKPQNILLDEKLAPKVSDFGLAKLMGGEETHVFTTMRGTPGYLAPEWLTSAISEKSDVYSYGVVLLELVSGRHNYRRGSGEEGFLLSVWASEKLEEGKPLDVLEDGLRELLVHETEKKQAETVVSIAVWCLQTDPNVRPSMSNVVLVLEGLVEAQRPPALRFESTDVKKLQSFISSSSSGSSVPIFSSFQVSSR